MKKVKMFLVAAVLAAVAPIAVAEEARQSGQDDAKLTRDQLRAAVQEICPVTGQKLGSMGTPVKTKIGQEEVFLCCRGCSQKKVKPEHWDAIHANFARAQGKCPVMNRPLPASAKSTIVEGQVVYICCPPCAKKIEADPKTYLQKVDELYSASLKAKKNSR